VSLLEELEASRKQVQEQEEESLSGGEVLTEAVKNLPSSAAKLVTDVTYPIRHPIETAQSLASLGRGVVKLIAPGEPTTYDEDEEAAKAVGKFFADRYGSFDGFKQSFATDPLGVASDVAIIFTGGAGLAAKVPGVAGKTTQTISKIGTAIDPVLGGAKLLGATAVGAGKVTAPLLGLTTGAGTDAIQVAARAGASSPEVQKMFLDNLRGNVAPEEVVPKAISALKERQTATRGKFKKDKKTLQLEAQPVNFTNIKQAIKSFEDGYKFEGVSELSANAQKKLSDLKKIVKVFEDNPKLHNAKGLDILKRRIDAEYPTGLNVGDSGVVVSQLRNVVKSKILDEVPGYGKVMKDYETAVKLERQFMQELSIGKNKQAGTTLRKLQSALRNNVNTSYGNRLNMLEDLDPSLITEIGGQALSSVTPRGLQGLSASGFLGYGAFVNPASLAALPFQSPRLVGETAFKIGQLEKGLAPLKGQTALDIARGARFTGEVMRADDVDNAELLRILLENKEEQAVDTSAINSIKKDANALAKEFDEEEEDKTFAEGGMVNGESENIADTIMRKINMMFTPVDLQNEVINNQVVPLQRISKDAQSNKYNDQVFKELQNYVQRLDAEIKQTKFVPLQRLKNVVDRAINNKIDEGFTADDEDMQNQLQYAPELYNQYIGLDSSDEPFEAREKTANKILEKIINKKFTPVQASNFLLSHNRFAPKDSIPLLVNKLAETIPEKQFESAENSLKDAMLIKVFEPKQKNVNTMTANKYDALLQQNKDVFDSLFTNQELADLQSFKDNVVPEITKKTTTNPNQSKFLFVSALAETGLLGTKKSTSTTSSIQVARDSLKKLQKPLVAPPQNIEPETDIAMSQDIPQIEVQEPNNLAENEEDMSFLQSNIGQFSLPQMNQPAFDLPESDLAPPQMLSPTILPDEKDREIAMRQMGGLGSLV
jgi:hypothetical protein